MMWEDFPVELAREKKQAALEEIKAEIASHLKDKEEVYQIMKLCNKYRSYDLTPPKYFLEVKYE